MSSGEGAKAGHDSTRDSRAFFTWDIQLNTDQRSALGHIALAKLTSLVIPNLLLFILMGTLAGNYIGRNQSLVTLVFLSFAGTVSGFYYLQQIFRVKVWEPSFIGHWKVILKWGVGIGALLSIPRLILCFSTRIEISSPGLFVDITKDWFSGLVFFFLAVIFVPVAEELFYRGLIYSIMRQRFHARWAYAVSSILFTIGHPHHIPALFMGLILCWVFERSKSLGAPTMVHILANATWLMANYAQAYWIK